MKREPAMESYDPLLQVMNTLLGGEDEKSQDENFTPGFRARDFRQLGRMLFWPLLLSVTLACCSLLLGLAAS